MGHEGYERSIQTAFNDKTDDAQSLSVDQWRSMDNDNSKYGYAAMTGTDKNDLELVWNGARAVPTTFAAFASSSGLRAGLSPMQILGGVGLGLGAEYLIDKTFFDDQPIRGGSMAFSFIGGAAIMMSPLAMRFKVPAMVASHVVGKLIDKYAD
jgi:hypothetical protein